MKFRLLLIVILQVSTGFLIAGSEFTGIFTTINPSATAYALGIEFGTAYIWENNPLNSWSNPALLAYNNGMSWGWSRDQWFEDIISDMYFNSSYLSYANQDFGILVPMINTSGKFGTTFDYGKSEIYDSQGYLIGTFHSYETCSRFAIAKKLFHYNILHDTENTDSFSLSTGYDFRYITSRVNSILIDSIVTTHGTMHGLGFLGHYIHHQRLSLENSFLTFEATAGYYRMNLFKNNMSYESDNFSLPYGNRFGLSGKISFHFGNLISFPLYFFQDNISFCYTYDNAKYGDWENEWGNGYEFGFFNTLFLRWGEYYDKHGSVKMNTFGIGIKYNINDTFFFEYNYASYGRESQNSEKKDDLMISVDLMKVLKKK